MRTAALWRQLRLLAPRHRRRKYPFYFQQMQPHQQRQVPHSHSRVAAHRPLRHSITDRRLAAQVVASLSALSSLLRSLLPSASSSRCVFVPSDDSQAGGPRPNSRNAYLNHHLSTIVMLLQAAGGRILHKMLSSRHQHFRACDQRRQSRVVRSLIQRFTLISAAASCHLRKLQVPFPHLLQARLPQSAPPCCLVSSRLCFGGVALQLLVQILWPMQATTHRCHKDVKVTPMA